MSDYSFKSFRLDFSFLAICLLCSHVIRVCVSSLLCVCACRGLSEGLVLAVSVVDRVVLVVLWVVEVVGLMAVVAVTDDRMLDAFALQLFLLVKSLQLSHQLFDEGLRSSRAPTTSVKLSSNQIEFHKVPISQCLTVFLINGIHFQCSSWFPMTHQIELQLF